jgi:hypothetical protein
VHNAHAGGSFQADRRFRRERRLAPGRFHIGFAEEVRMPEYRACLMSDEGSVVRSVQLLCPDDDTAKEYARQLVDGHDIELWKGEIRIERFIKRDP